MFGLTQPHSLERLFRPFLEEFESFGRFAGRYPALNIWETPEAYHVEAALPGLDLADVEILVQDNTVVLRGENRAPETEGVRPLRRERELGPFERIVTLPGRIDSARVDAHFALGILTIDLPKHESQKPRKIVVRNADANTEEETS